VGSLALQPEDVPPGWAARTQADGTLVVPLDSGSLGHFLASVPDEAARRKVRGGGGAAGLACCCRLRGVALPAAVLQGLLQAHRARRIPAPSPQPPAPPPPHTHTQQTPTNPLQVYMAGYSGPQHNLALLGHMLGASRSIARLLGHASFAHYKAAGATLAGTPDAVVPFLEDLAAAVRPLADANVQVGLEGGRAGGLRAAGCRG
jgi:hypothetical protein